MSLLTGKEETWEERMTRETQEKVTSLFPLGNKATSEQGRKIYYGANGESDPESQPEKALRYNEGKLPWHLVDFRALEPMVRVLQYGAKKYAPDNWKKGLSLKEIRDSFIRHMVAWNSGEEVDLESGEKHIGHLMCNLLFYAYFTEVETSKARD